MPIDPSVLTPTLIRPISVAGVVHDAAVVQEAQARAQAYRDKQMEMARDRQENDQIRAVLQQSGGQLDEQTLGAIRQISVPKAMDIEKLHNDSTKSSMEIENAKIDHDLKVLGYTSRQLAGITDQHSYDMARAGIKATTGQDLPEQYDPALVQSWQEKGMTYAEKLNQQREDRAAKFQELTATRQQSAEDRAQGREERMAAAQQQQLGMEGQRLGLEKQRVGLEAKRLAQSAVPVGGGGAAGPSNNPDVKYWADQIQKDPTFATSPLIGGAANAGLRTAIAHEIASRGGSLDKITAQTRQMGETAKAILPHISTIEQEAKTLESRGLMGPIGSRWREFVHGTLRANELTTNAADAQMIGRFQADLGLMRSAVARAHGGARGGGSPTMIEHMKTIIQGGGDLPTFLGSMDAVRNWMQTYADDAKQDSGPKPTDGSTPPPASSGGTVRMRAPGGQMKDVPADKVEFYRSHGAVVVK